MKIQIRNKQMVDKTIKITEYIDTLSSPVSIIFL